MKYIASLILITLWCRSFGQVTVSVRINSGSSTTTCTDFVGTAEAAFGINVAGTGNDYYGQTSCGYNTLPRTQYSEAYSCPSVPNVIQICLTAFEDDGPICLPGTGTECLTTECSSYTLQQEVLTFPLSETSFIFNLCI